VAQGGLRRPASSTILRPSLATIAARGLEPDEIETDSNGVRQAIYRDPDGNEQGFGGEALDTGGDTRPPGEA
jgi:hypothetical protein